MTINTTVAEFYAFLTTYSEGVTLNDLGLQLRSKPATLAALTAAAPHDALFLKSGILIGCYDLPNNSLLKLLASWRNTRTAVFLEDFSLTLLSGGDCLDSYDPIVSTGGELIAFFTAAQWRRAAIVWSDLAILDRRSPIDCTELATGNPAKKYTLASGACHDRDGHAQFVAPLLAHWRADVAATALSTLATALA